MPPEFTFPRAFFGGNMWESNPPGRFLAPHNGFEDRGAQPAPRYSHKLGYYSIYPGKKQLILIFNEKL